MMVKNAAIYEDMVDIIMSDWFWAYSGLMKIDGLDASRPQGACFPISGQAGSK